MVPAGINLGAGGRGSELTPWPDHEFLFWGTYVSGQPPMEMLKL